MKAFVSWSVYQLIGSVYQLAEASQLQPTYKLVGVHVLTGVMQQVAIGLTTSHWQLRTCYPLDIVVTRIMTAQ